VSIRDAAGEPVDAGVSGEIWVRGEQVSGEYVGQAGSRADGWFPTRDGGWLDEDGFLYVEGRIDDVIVRFDSGEVEALVLDTGARVAP
jgi:long-subunit acyl-CoA synthetase (AMP-forming)